MTSSPDPRSHKDFEARIFSLGQKTRITKGGYLFHAEDKADSFFYILNGEIRVYRVDDQGREIEIVRLYPGDFLGEAIMFASKKYPAFAQAVKETEALSFSRAAVDQSIKRDPSIAYFFIRLMAEKCVILNQRIESLGLMTVRQRLIRYLLSRCSGDRQCIVTLDVTKSDLAKILGTISETLSRNLRDLQEEGLIEVKADQIRIQNCPLLRSEVSVVPSPSLT